MTQLEHTMQDLSKGYVPIIIVIAMIATALVTGQWMKSNELNLTNLDKQVGALTLQVAQLSSQVTQLSLAIAKGPTLPDSVAYKADILKFCLVNRELKCPEI